jgi:hypothetical protein
MALVVAVGMLGAASPAGATSPSDQFHVFGISPGGNLFQDYYMSGWSGWSSIGNGGEALSGTPAVAYDPDNGTYHVFAVATSSGAVWQVTFVPGVGWGTWQNLGGDLQDGLAAVYVTVPSRSGASAPQGICSRTRSPRTGPGGSRSAGLAIC